MINVRAQLVGRRGYLMIFALVFMAILMTSSVGLMGYSRQQVLAERQADGRQEALHIAEAAVDQAIYQLNQNGNYSGESDTALGNGDFTTTITTIDQYTKRITATGQVTYSNGLVAERVVEATASIDASTIAFAYGVQVGDGGLTMSNNSVINGNVYSGGSISGSGSVTGDVTVAAGVSATQDQQWVVQNGDSLFGNLSTRTSLAQSFVPSETNPLTNGRVYLKKVGNPGNITVRIVSNNSGSPSKSVLASGSISASLVTGNYSLIDATLSSNPALTAGATYWIMLTASVNASNYYSWGIDTNTPGTGKYTNNWNATSPVWTSSGGKYNFETYMGGSVTSISGISIGGNARAQSMSSCSIGGNAYYEISNSCSVDGSQNAGVAAPAAAPLAISQAQIDEWKETATSGGVISGTYTVNGSATMGPQKIDGDLVLNNGAVLTLTGPVWVNGDVSFSNNVQVRIDPSLGGSGTVLIADYTASSTQKGKISLSNNVTLAGSGQAGSYPLLISMYSGTGAAIPVSNNAANSIFYAPNGTITLSNNASVKAMTAKSISLSNNAVVNYDSGLQHTSFSSGPGGSWTFESGSYAITR